MSTTPEEEEEELVISDEMPKEQVLCHQYGPRDEDRQKLAKQKTTPYNFCHST